MKRIITAVLFIGLFTTWTGANGAPLRPPAENNFKGRIAYSADGNHNDADDWIASPMALAILAEAGLTDRLVHFDYNCILPQTNREWEKTHEESVLGAAQRYGFKRSMFFDCQKNLDAAIAGIAKAVNDSSAENPLYFVIAGPVEVPYRGIEKSEPAKRKFVYCISHSRWNDGFASDYKFTFTKRSVIEQGVNWVQIRDQNRLLSLSPYKRPAKPEEFTAFFWMRDSGDTKVRFLWERMLASTRPDPSDAGMAYFLVSGDEDCDAMKLKRLIADHELPRQTSARRQVRLEAENFRHFEGFVLEERKDKKASHQLGIISNGTRGQIRTQINEPFMSAAGRYDIEVRHRETERCRYVLRINGAPQGMPWDSAFTSGGWTNQVIPGVEIRMGDEVQLEVDGASAWLDYVQFNLLD
jgi:hypothetical protein